MPRNFINWSCKLTLCQRERDGGGGQPPVKSEVRAQSNKVGRLCFLGGRCSRISRGTPEARSHLCVCRASFLMTFAMSGVPLAGSRQLLLADANNGYNYFCRWEYELRNERFEGYLVREKCFFLLYNLPYHTCSQSTFFFFLVYYLEWIEFFHSGAWARRDPNLLN